MVGTTAPSGGAPPPKEVEARPAATGQGLIDHQTRIDSRDDEPSIASADHEFPRVELTEERTP